jgi:hypothetical protein
MRQTAFVSTVMTHLIEIGSHGISSINHYTILYYTILYYTILYYTILYYTILYYTIPHESEAGGSATDPVIPAKNHRQVLRIRASITELLSHPTLVVQLRSVESLRSKGLRARRLCLTRSL